jgi:N-acetylmuramoyl-L-alanine amidase
MRNIKLHIIHCSDSDYGDVATLRKWHLQRGFNDIGYHFIIRRDGEIEVGRPLSQIGAHAKGYNGISIGTCLIGKEDFTARQFSQLRKLHADLLQQFPGIEVQAHNELNANKTCPNFDVRKVLNGGQG